jgi:gliding motility-associated-like protein
MYKHFTLLGMLLWLSVAGLEAQTYPFARLTGAPLNTTGWTLSGQAAAGDTPADNNGAQDELILCNPELFGFGAAFFNQPVDIADCPRWIAEFDYRIWDGTGADGIAFCFLANPPTTFTDGGNIGIPAQPRGLMVILDTYLNCPGTTSVPKLLIRYYDGSVTFGGRTESLLECPAQSQPEVGPLSILRQPVYNNMRIAYDEGNISVSVNGQERLRGFYRIAFSGYFGFTSSTGGLTDRHSIRNFTLFTLSPSPLRPDAGPDRLVCSGDSVQLGISPIPGDPVGYSWTPTEGLSNPRVANPKVRIVNTQANPVTYRYFVSRRASTNSGNTCAYSDAVEVTVLPEIQVFGALSVCPNVSGVVYRISNPQPNTLYQWEVTGGTLRSGQNTTEAVIDWGPARSNAGLRIQASGSLVCQTFYPVVINQHLIPPRPFTQKNKLCLAQAQNIAYFVPASPGSVYTWGVSENGSIVSGQGTSQIKVNWNQGRSGRVWLSETSTTRTDVCTGLSDTLNIELDPKPQPDAAFIEVASVLTDPQQGIEVQFHIRPDPDLKTTLRLRRRPLLPNTGNWTLLRQVTAQDSLYQDSGVNSSEGSYQYQLEAQDTCGFDFPIRPHASIWLRGETQEGRLPDKGYNTRLEWNAYTGWPEGVQAYQVWQWLEDDSQPRLYASLSDTVFTALNASEGFRHRYRIKALRKNGQFSWSNELELHFENQLRVYNVITPNSDNFNQRWVIENIELYPQHEVRIVTRYGKEVYSSQNYQQDWDGKGLPSGVYFYYISLPGKAAPIRGWVQVLR